MPNVPEEYLEKYAEDMLKKEDSVNHLVERALDVKLVAAVKAAVKLDTKDITVEEFNKLAEND